MSNRTDDTSSKENIPITDPRAHRGDGNLMNFEVLTYSLALAVVAGLSVYLYFA